MHDAKTLSQQVVTDAMNKTSKTLTQAKPQVRDIKTAILDMKPLLQQALPKHLTAERVIQMATNYIRQNPIIAKCSEQSLLGAIMQASILGLEPIPALGQCYFVPRKANRGTKEKPNWIDEVNFEIGYKGYIKLAHNTKDVKMVYAEAIYEHDDFKHRKGVFKILEHTPATGNRGAFIGAYAVIHFMNGGYDFEYLDKTQIESRRLRNPMQKNGIKGAWLTDYESMAKGKAFKALLSTKPLSAEIQAAIVADGAIINEKAFTNNQTGVDLDAIEFPEDDHWTTEFDAETGEVHP